MKRLLLPFVLLTCGTTLWAQVESAPEAPKSEGTAQPSTSAGVGVPTEITAGTRGPSISEAGAPTNFMSGGLDLGLVYDDNVISSAARKGVFQYQVAPEISIHRKGKRSEYDISYYTGMTFSPQVESRNEMLQDLSSKFSFDLSRHVDLHLRQTLRHQSTPFASNFGDTGSITSTNQFVVTPLATRQSVEFGGDLGWRFRPHSLVGVSGEYSRLRFSNVVGDQSLLPINATDFKVYFAQQLSARQSVGAATTFQHLSSPDEVAATTNVVGFQVFDVFRFTDHFSLSVFGGPQSSHTRFHTSTQDAIDRSNRLTFSGGAALHWDGRRVNFTASYEDSINDGGGVAQFVRLRAGEAGTRIKLAKTWDLGLSFGIGDNEVLGTLSEFNQFRTIAGTITIEHQLSSHMRLQTRYEHFHQSLGPQQNLLLATERNRLVVKVSYRFNRPLGSLASER